jgi:hypothetical protein
VASRSPPHILGRGKHYDSLGGSFRGNGEFFIFLNIDFVSAGDA